jgi:hypothetical protein
MLMQCHINVKPIQSQRNVVGSVGQLSVGGGAEEGQPGFSLVLVKAVLFHQWDQSLG